MDSGSAPYAASRNDEMLDGFVAMLLAMTGFASYYGPDSDRAELDPTPRSCSGMWPTVMVTGSKAKR
jgi:hypothetical protein